MHTPDGWIRVDTGQPDLRDTFVVAPPRGVPGTSKSAPKSISPPSWTNQNQYGTAIPPYVLSQALDSATLNSSPLSDTATVVQVSTYNQGAKSPGNRLGKDDPCTCSNAESFDSWWLRAPPKRNIFMGEGLWFWLKRVLRKDDPNIVTRVKYLRCSTKSTMVTAPPHHAEFYHYAYFMTIYLLLFVTSLIVFNFTDIVYAKLPMRDPKGLLWSLDPYLKLFFLSFVAASVVFSVILIMYFLCFVRPFKPV